MTSNDDEADKIRVYGECHNSQDMTRQKVIPMLSSSLYGLCQPHVFIMMNTKHCDQSVLKLQRQNYDKSYFMIFI